MITNYYYLLIITNRTNKTLDRVRQKSFHLGKVSCSSLVDGLVIDKSDPLDSSTEINH